MYNENDSSCVYSMANPIDGELLPYGILSGGKEIHGGRKSHVTPAIGICQPRVIFPPFYDKIR